jgi:hypothetical protein
MFANSRLLIAAAILVGTGSVALAQSARYDYQDDKPMSYGPQSPGQTTANPAQGPIGQDAYNPNDGTDDKTMSYGARN